MAEFEEHKKFWGIFYSPLVLIVLLIISVFLTRATWQVYTHERVSMQNRERLENELAMVKDREAILKEQVAALETPKGVEDEIRSKFNVAKEGEQVAIIVNDTNATSATSTPVKEKTWWQKFVGFFGE